MHRIDTSTAQVDKFGSGKNGFTGGNPQTGVLPTALDADYFDSLQEEIAGVIEAAGLTLSKANNSQLTAAIKALVGPGRLLNIQVITNSGTYSPTAGTKKAVIEMVGGGGASGSTPASSSSVNFASGGGGGGAYAKFMVNNPVATPVSIGAAGVVSGGTGGAGGVTSFGSIASVSGGGGSAYSQASGSALIANGGSGAQTISLSSDCVPILKIFGESGSAAVMINSGSGGSNSGGSSVMGTGGGPNGNGNGNPGTGYGAGAGGAMRGTNNTGATASGANGTAGVVIVWEYA